MSRPSGFVPIPFPLVGKLLLAIGGLGVVLVLIAALSGWFALPSIVTWFSIAAIVIGLYLLFVVPKESLD